MWKRAWHLFFKTFRGAITLVRYIGLEHIELHALLYHFFLSKALKSNHVLLCNVAWMGWNEYTIVLLVQGSHICFFICLWSWQFVQNFHIPNCTWQLMLFIKNSHPSMAFACNMWIVECRYNITYWIYIYLLLSIQNLNLRCVFKYVFYLLVYDNELVNSITWKFIDLLKENYWNDLSTTSSTHVPSAN